MACADEEANITKKLLRAIESKAELTQIDAIFFEQTVDSRKKLANSTAVATRSTPLFTAVWYGRLDVVQLLLQHNAKINWTNDNNARPIHLAVQQNKVDIVQCLLDKNAILSSAEIGSLERNIQKKYSSGRRLNPSIVNILSSHAAFLETQDRNLATGYSDKLFAYAVLSGDLVKTQVFFIMILIVIIIIIIIYCYFIMKIESNLELRLCCALMLGIFEEMSHSFAHPGRAASEIWLCLQVSFNACLRTGAFKSSSSAGRSHDS
jgi:hypothetical protein